MSKLLPPLLACLWVGAALPAGAQAIADAQGAEAVAGQPDSLQLEGELQRLPWKQFKSVVESVPKLKADVDAYGPLGWQYVKAHYATYRWRKNIDKLDAAQKRQLAALIEEARKSR